MANKREAFIGDAMGRKTLLKITDLSETVTPSSPVILIKYKSFATRLDKKKTVIAFVP